jgi:hypothetical protein
MTVDTEMPRMGGAHRSWALNDSLNPSHRVAGVKLTPEALITRYNNFYEWGLANDQSKQLSSIHRRERTFAVRALTVVFVSRTASRASNQDAAHKIGSHLSDDVGL